MIQRKQTLFLLELVFLGIALLFVPSTTIITTSGPAGITLTSLTPGHNATTWHTVAMVLNFLGLVISTITIFLYRKRELQVTLCYTLLVIWLVLTAVITFCPLVATGDEVAAVHAGFLAPVIGLFALLAAYLAARYIKKDIALLKNADRIR